MAHGGIETVTTFRFYEGEFQMLKVIMAAVTSSDARTGITVTSAHLSAFALVTLVS